MKQADLLLVKNNLTPGEYAIQRGQSLSAIFLPWFFFFLFFNEEACNFVSTDVSEASGDGVPTVCVCIYERSKWYNKSGWTDSHKISIYS